MKEWTFDAKIENIPELTALIEQELEALDCGIRAQTQIDVAIDEVFTNIASYAYDTGDGHAVVRFEFDEDSRTASITFEDAGMPFNPLERADPDTSLPLSERQIGGLGIFLVKKTMDAMEYRREGDKNVLTIRKRI